MFNVVKDLALATYNTRSWWVGANDRREEGKWQWEHLNTNPTKVSAMWQNGEPNNVGGNQHCARMYKRFSYKLDDFACNVKDTGHYGLTSPLCQRTWRKKTKKGSKNKAGEGWKKTSHGTFLFGMDACKGGGKFYKIVPNQT